MAEGLPRCARPPQPHLSRQSAQTPSGLSTWPPLTQVAPYWPLALGQSGNRPRSHHPKAKQVSPGLLSGFWLRTPQCSQSWCPQTLVEAQTPGESYNASDTLSQESEREPIARIRGPMSRA